MIAYSLDNFVIIPLPVIMRTGGSSLSILVFEDHTATARLITTAFEETSEAVSVRTVSSGHSGLDMLYGEADEQVDPDLILLDLGLPDTKGETVLESIRTNDNTRHLPIVVLSGQSDEQTIKRCYENGANTFIPKPDDFDGYRFLAKTMLRYWQHSANLPAESS